MSLGISPAQLVSLLRASAGRANTALGQHFLTDASLLEKIAALARADRSTLVLEIGPGAGTLTAALAEQAGGVLAVEKDRRFEDFHSRVFSDARNVAFIYGDALRLDLAAEARRQAQAWDLRKLVLAGNLPFQITSPLLFGQLGPGVPWERIVVMVQREVADRIAASPRSKAYGVLTVKLAYWWRVAERLEVPAGMFHPRPKVDASVLALEPVAPEGRVPDAEWEALSPFVERAFNQRRKKLYNSPASGGDPAGRARLRDALAALGISPDARAEELSPADFRRLRAALAV